MAITGITTRTVAALLTGALLVQLTACTADVPSATVTPSPTTPPVGTVLGQTPGGCDVVSLDTAAFSPDDGARGADPTCVAFTTVAQGCDVNVNELVSVPSLSGKSAEEDVYTFTAPGGTVQYIASLTADLEAELVCYGAPRAMTGSVVTAFGLVATPESVTVWNDPTLWGTPLDAFTTAPVTPEATPTPSLTPAPMTAPEPTSPENAVLGLVAMMSNGDMTGALTYAPADGIEQYDKAVYDGDTLTLGSCTPSEIAPNTAATCTLHGEMTYVVMETFRDGPTWQVGSVTVYGD